ncbi:Bacterial regulatory protein, luxR family [Enhygromyxa salina]|uniref:Bacterial regulatory protein, luxR family n=1 Tax=Enhygromyxa salina TaxID=215803 RepID=A0A2S9YLE5_9BACT|nr:helix-turn-helix transcriptional regulator [Enhygromyxa salina]PRQ05904.1 Bacterial regulatory protein, luxR family [Enhygromyxa salina]
MADANEEDRRGRRGAKSRLRVSRVGDTLVVSAGITSLPRVLSESERAVVHALLAGRSNAEIAELRRTSVKTVANQLHAVYRKLGVGSRDELAALVTGPMAGGRERGDSRDEL